MERQNSEAQRERQRRRIFEIVEIGAADDALSRGYDFFGSFFRAVIIYHYHCTLPCKF